MADKLGRKHDNHGHIIGNDETDGQECRHSGESKTTGGQYIKGTKNSDGTFTTDYGEKRPTNDWGEVIDEDITFDEDEDFDGGYEEEFNDYVPDYNEQGQVNNGFNMYDVDRYNHDGVRNMPLKPARIEEFDKFNNEDGSYMEESVRIKPHNSHKDKKMEADSESLKKYMNQARKSGQPDDVNVFASKLIQARKNLNEAINNESLDKAETLKHFGEIADLLNEDGNSFKLSTAFYDEQKQSFLEAYNKAKKNYEKSKNSNNKAVASMISGLFNHPVSEDDVERIRKYFKEIDR